MSAAKDGVAVGFITCTTGRDSRSARCASLVLVMTLHFLNFRKFAPELFIR